MTEFSPELRLNLLGGYELYVRDQIIPVSSSFQRLTIFLALNDRLLPRTYVAGRLWPEVTSGRASANLRASLWRTPDVCRPLIDVSAHHLRMSPSVPIDFRQATELAEMLIGDRGSLDESDLSATAMSTLKADLLPEWYEDDWITVERERFHQLRMHSLEVLSERLVQFGCHGDAVDAALAAVRAEPLRESAHRALIRAYLAEGNWAEANRQYRLCRRLMRDELGVEPTIQLQELFPVRVGAHPPGAFSSPISDY